MANRLSRELEKNEDPKWLSTHGLGVHYLHVRIDNYPKYYHFEEYKTEQNQQEDSSQNGPSQPSKDKPSEKGSNKVKQDNNYLLSIENDAAKENLNPQDNKLLLISCGAGAILLIGIGSVIWWKWKQDKTNQK